MSPAPEPTLVDEVARLREALRERDDMLAMAAHELRNPLHSLALQLRLARMMAEGGNVLAPAACIAKAEGMLERYTEQLTLLLDLARLRADAYPLQLRCVDLARTLSVLVDNLGPEAEFRGAALRLRAPATLEVTTDAAAIEQIVSNLLLNAFKHAGARLVTVVLAAAGAHAVRITVADDGRGIAPADQQRIFGKFEVAREGMRGEGSGLGLWIVRKLLAALDGSIELASRPNQGSTFTLTLPTAYPCTTTS